MNDRTDFQFFDNYEEDGQLSLFSADYDDWDEDWTEDAENSEGAESDAAAGDEKKASVGGVTGAAAPEGSAVKTAKQNAVSDKKTALAEVTGSIGTAENSGPDIRVKYCACCGKLLFVREETAGFRSECNNCGVKYFQKL